MHYREEINEEKLSIVYKAEQILLDMGFNQIRDRIHGKIAGIEVCEKDFPKLNFRNALFCKLLFRLMRKKAVQ